MSELPVNDHLEGILSDFEALKRSFDIDDDDNDIPASPVPTPISPSSCHFIHSQSPANEDHGKVSHSFTFNNNHKRLGSAVFPHSRTGSSPSPVLKSRSVVGSLSFNRGSVNKPLVHNNGSSVSRASSFQSRLKPNTCTLLSAAGSDDDSLHSSTSSLEYSGVSAYTMHLKMASYHNPAAQPQLQQLQADTNLKRSPVHGLRGLNHGGRSPDGGAFMGIQRDANGDRFSPGFKYADANANWNDHFTNESYSGQRNVRPSLPKAKDTPRLNKFPLDLDSLVNNISTNNEDVTRCSNHLSEPQSSPTSPSASLSSLDSSSDTLSHLYSHIPPCSPTHSHNNGSFSPAQNFHLDILPGPQVAHVSHAQPSASSPSSTSSTSSPRAVGLSEDGEDIGRDSVGLILQRIASFSWPAPAGGAQPAPHVPCHTEPVADWKREKTVRDEAAEERERKQFSPMEEKDEKERMIIGGEEDDECIIKEQEIIPTFEDEKEESCVRAEQEKETGSEVENLRKELELYPSVPGLQMNFVGGADLFGYVGIEAVLDQMRMKTMKAGFEFNIMVVGQSGLGKSTLVNTLFKSKISRKSCTPNYEEKICKTVKLHAVSHVIEEKGVKMKLTVVDTPGFGDQINNENCWEPIVKYINEQYEKFLREELNVNRKRRIPDSRVHCCIYFLPATGHRLRPIDVEFMKRLGKMVSIVPVIAKADTLTVEERQEFKEQIRKDLDANGICVYPQEEFDEDPDERLLNHRIRESIPFAVVGTDQEHQVNGNKVLGRKTKWGIIEVENVAHCEFANLRDLLIRSHLQDLKDVTHNILYENYRVRRLNESNITFSELELSSWPTENGTDKSQL
ncbi:uncharacterized protein LOC114468709 isoform X1 [Gouania willdenowi]|uniref:Neuronal-specific septin-3-like n=2 Tax=Gouania willdenowi TaxID=441366 RepID=A0A8C5GIF0_GOUWI|nr:uncharacterized protein LOC114468709 isoform X1 [Gouania willdenowi]XP_028311549.1 uncharacterized protein LOC114468709 isoform X1 [Gouania willdenowi]